MNDIQKLKEFFSNSLDENKKTDLVKKLKEAITAAYETKSGETAVDMAKKQLDALGVKYELGNEFKPFKAIYKPINKSDRWYDKFDEIVDLFNLASAVKQSMNEAPQTKYSVKPSKKGFSVIKTSTGSEITSFDTEEKAKQHAEKLNKMKFIPKEKFNEAKEEDAVKKTMKEAKFMSGILSGKDFINAKLKNYPKAVAKVNQLIDMIGEDKFTIEMAEWIFDFFNNAHFESPMNEAKEEDKVDTITMDIPLFLRMLEYSREDASQDMDLHDVTEKAISLGKERGILQMDDYDEIIGTTEKVNEVNLKQAKLSSSEYQKAKKLKDFKSSDWKWNADEDLYTKVNEAELTEAYVPSNIKEFAKRKGVSSLVNKIAGWAEKVGAGIRGGTAIGYNYSTLILDMTYQGSEIRINTDNDTVTLYDEPVNSFPEFKSVYLDNKEEDNGLEERIAEAFNKINEELCPAGKAYIKRRKAAGEKSSAYLSGRAVKVCKGQMSGKAKKK